MSVIVEFSMFPTDVGESKSVYVSRIIKMIADSGFNYKLTPMSTIVEADKLSDILSLIENAYNLLETDCNRVYSVIKMDIRKGDENLFDKKIKSVENKIGEVKK